MQPSRLTLQADLDIVGPVALEDIEGKLLAEAESIVCIWQVSLPRHSPIAPMHYPGSCTLLHALLIPLAFVSSPGSSACTCSGRV